MKTMKKWMLPGILGLAVLCGGLRNTQAREPRIVSNLGAVLISCSVDSDQMMVAGIGPGYGPDMVVEVLGQPRSVKYGKATMEYTYPGRVIQLVKYSEDQNYQVNDIITTHTGDATADGVQVGMGEMVLNDSYGQADAVWTTTYDSPKLSGEDNARNHARFDETVYEYHANKTQTLSFTVRQGIIRKIHIHQAE